MDRRHIFYPIEPDECDSASMGIDKKRIGSVWSWGERVSHSGPSLHGAIGATELLVNKAIIICEKH